MAKFVAVMSSDLVWEEMEDTNYAGVYHGAEAVLEHVMGPISCDYDDDFAAVPEEFIDGGDAIVVLGTYSGTVKATGNKLQAPYVHIWKVKNEKVVLFKQMTNPILFNQAFAD